MTKIDTEDILSDFCTDILTLDENEWFLENLFRNKSGKWIKVTEIFKSEKKQIAEIITFGEELFVTWLEYPLNEPDYVLVFFHDAAIGWDMTASYNRMRLISP